MNCGNCGAPAHLDFDRGLIVCDYCGSEAAPPAGEDGVQVLGDSHFRCPVCQTSLSEGRLNQFKLLYCTSCHGMLIGMDVFMPLIENMRAFRTGPSAVLRFSEPAAIAPRTCPRCSGAMDHHTYFGGGNVYLDTCETCSVNWLDKGELQRIVAAPDPTYGVPLYSNYGGAGESDL